MRNSAYIRFSICLLLFVSLLSPTFALASTDGKKHFSAGMTAEVSEQWDKAVEEFALAVADNPKNPEYRLHYTRSLFNASQMYMKRGTTLAGEKDYAGAYLAFRKAYGYDPVNELAKSEMERMLRLQQAVVEGENPDVKTDSNGTVRLVPTGFQKQTMPDATVPQRFGELINVLYPTPIDLQTVIKDLARSLDLNVLFDAETFRQRQTVSIELKNVTAAKALDYIFLQQSLFFQKVGPRTILVASQNRRTNYQQLVLRTFYLANAAPEDVQKVVQTAIPAQPGRVPTITLVDKATNSLTVRDTEENIRLIGKLINSLDKDRAEVVMDVQIYEVSKSDLLQFGTQIGDKDSLINLGGTNRGVVGLTGNSGILGRTSLGLGLIIPPITFQALQNKNNSKLIASTQIHAFNNEDSSARIGARVPVRSATISNGFNNTGTGTGTTGGNSFVGDVINYEQTGLTLKFKPIVFPNQDVQVAMEIESKDIDGTTNSALSLNPTFTERTIKGTARIQNNKTLLLASVAQGKQSDGRAGLPLLGLIPILGRFFSSPTKDNRQVDVVIAVTPRVIRAPAILPEDEIERQTGSVGSPTSASVEAMIIQEETEEQLAAARRTTNTAQVQLPDQKTVTPAYTKTTASMPDSSTTENAPQNQTTASAQPAEKTEMVESNIRPIDASVKTLQIAPTADNAENKPQLQETSLKSNGEAQTESEKSDAPVATLQLLQNLPQMKAGDKWKIAVMVKSATAFRSAVLGMNFDAKKLAVKSVSYGEVFGNEMAQTPAKPFFNEGGKMFVSLASPKDTAGNSSGILAYIEVEALADGKQQITFDRDVLNFLTADGKNFSVKF
ncbi:MAG: hypothetical protein M3033_03100 [Acidobacteriota bacterium]|nr:hypothetical protein [Acidobacteriota bacterium]